MNENTKKIPNCHELDLRIKCILLNCQPTLAELLSYFVNLPWEGIKCLGNTGERLMEIVQNKRIGNDNILIINNFELDVNARSVPISTLKPQEICGFLLSKTLGLMRSLGCCSLCEHECLSCARTNNQVPLVHIDSVDCYKKRCNHCGMDCMKQAYIQHLVLIEQLANINNKIQDGGIYESFRQNQPFEELIEYKKWDQLWKAVQKAIASFCDFLVSKSVFDQDKWKNIDMDMRIILTKRAFALNVLFSDRWHWLNHSTACDDFQFNYVQLPSQGGQIQQQSSQSMPPLFSQEISVEEEEKANRSRCEKNHPSSILEDGRMIPQLNHCAGSEIYDEDRAENVSVSTPSKATHEDLSRNNTGDDESFPRDESFSLDMCSPSLSPLLNSSPRVESIPKTDPCQQHQQILKQKSSSVEFPITTTPLQQEQYHNLLPINDDNPSPQQPSNFPSVGSGGSSNYPAVNLMDPDVYRGIGNLVQQQQQQHQQNQFEEGEERTLACTHQSHNFRQLSIISGPSETIDENEVAVMSLRLIPPPQPPPRSISPVDESNKNLFLIRGLPGSGKTTKANQLTNDNTVGTILATDDYFYDDNGEYVFNKDEIQQAHKWNQNRTENEMKSETSPICIDNTNITKAEMKPYVKLADKYNYKVHLLEPWMDTEWKHNINKCLEKSSKGASLKKKVLDNMKKKYAKNVTIDEIRECESKFH